MTEKDESSTTEERPEEFQFDPEEADKRYRPFSGFEEWAKCAVETERWERYRQSLDEIHDGSSEMLREALDVVKRAAAVDTGSIEGLYDHQRGFTFTVATEVATWQAALDAREKEVRDLIESQIRAYDFVLDFATERREIAQAWIRELHEKICETQETYQVHTEVGLQEQPLPHGEYKSHPNHVVSPDGSIHAWAPVDETQAEMQRLCEELRSEEFGRAHPVLQAAYAHYAFVAIHPFADGNGRVARALGSVYTYRAASVPLLILYEHQDEYYAALSAADDGNSQPFVDFIMARSLDAMQLARESLRTASVPEPDEILPRIQQLYRTRGGFTHQEVDRAGQMLRQLAITHLSERADEYSEADHLRVSVRKSRADYESDDPEYRAPVSGGHSLITIEINTSPPGAADVSRTYRIEVPRDAGREDDIRIAHPSPGLDDNLTARVDEILPKLSPSLELRARMWVDQVFGSMLDQLRPQVERAIEEEGY